VTGHHLHSETSNLRAQLPFVLVFLQTTLYKVWLVRIKEVGETGSTVRTHENVDCLLKKHSYQNKANMLSRILMISVSEKFLRVSEWTFTKKKKKKKKTDVSLSKTKYLYLLWTNSFNLSFRFEYGIIERELR